MDVSDIELPPFYCPIEPAIHPKVDEVEQRAIAWIDQFGFCGTTAERAWVIGTNSADFYARFAPESDMERLLTAVCWVYWGFAFDDAHCDEGTMSTNPAEFAALAGRVQRALEMVGPCQFNDPFAAAIHELGERLRVCATPVQVRRFLHAHRAWLFGVQWQIGNRSRRHMPSLDDYITMRLHSAGGEPTYAMLEIANGSEVPACEMDSPAVCALTEMAILVAALDNDRHSFAKEVSRCQAEQNIFTVLMRHNNVTLEQAVHDAVALRDRILCRFLWLREKVLLNASQELRRYLTDLGHGIRGNAEWGLRVARYLSLNDLTTGPGAISFPERISWADRAIDASPWPPPIPAITWWWDALDG